MQALLGLGGFGLTNGKLVEWDEVLTLVRGGRLQVVQTTGVNHVAHHEPAHGLVLQVGGERER